MSKRAERRRAMRAAGYHRSAEKKGRRPGVRQAQVDPSAEIFGALKAAGFRIARPKLEVPK